MSAPRASIVLVVRDEATLLFRCLSALAKLPDEPAFEVIVVDDGSVDETAAVFAAVEGDLRTVRNEYPRGFGPAFDQAAALARGDQLVFLRPDAVPATGWLEPLVHALDADSGLGAVQPRAVDIEGNDVGGSGFAPTQPRAAAIDSDDVGNPLWVCLAVLRAAYERVGGFNGSAQPGRAEKVTLIEALTAVGFGVAPCPASLVLLVPEDVALAAAA